MSIIPSDAQFRADTTGIDIVEKGSSKTNHRASFFKMEDVTQTVLSQIPGGSGVTSIIAGTNITVSPVGGTGVVTINSSGGGGISLGTQGQIPFMNATDDDFDYSNGLLWDDDNSRLGINRTPGLASLEVKGTSNNGYNTLFYNLSGPIATIKNDGNFGLGTTTLSARIQVVGSGSTSATTNLLLQNSSLTDLLRVTDNGDAQFGNGILLDTASDSVTRIYNNETIRYQSDNNTGTMHHFAIATGNSKTSGDVLSIDRGTNNNTNVSLLNVSDFLVVKNGGNVGINVTSPSARLQVKSSGNASAIVVNITNGLDTPILAVYEDRVYVSQRLEVFEDSAFFGVLSLGTSNEAMIQMSETILGTRTNGEVWFDGTDIKIQVSGVVYKLDKTVA